MRSLFLRIFLWFWLAMVAVVAVVVLTSPYWTRVRPAAARWEQQSFAWLVQEATASEIQIREQGVTSLPRGRRGRSDRPMVHLVDGHGEPVRGRSLPPPVAEVAARSRASGETELERMGPHFVLARPLVLDDGRQLTLVVSSRGGRRGGPPGPGLDTGPVEPPLLLPRLIGVVLVVGLLCYWLSRHLTAPLRSLDETVRALDDGDLEARAGDEVAGRRDEIGALARDFNSMADRLVGSLEGQRRLLRDVSHELRSPLARLKVAIELARRGGGDSTAPLERIDRESDRMEDLIARLLALARLEEGLADGDAERVDLEEVVRAVAEDASYEGGLVEVRSGGGPVEVLGEARLLHSVVDNLVRNGLGHGGGEVVMTLTRPRPGTVELRVEDGGEGVPEDQLERIFDPFHRVDEERDSATGGAGLGLAISRRAVSGHGGRLWAENLTGGGLAVVMTLPAADEGGDSDTVPRPRSETG